MLAAVAPLSAGKQVSGVKISYAREAGNDTAKTKKKTTTTVTVVEEGDETDSSADKKKGNATTLGQHIETMESPCSFIPPRLGADCWGYIVANLMYYTVFSPSYYVALMAGGIFNASIGFSLSGESFPTDEGSMIATGWKMVRDLLNLFFIFILLYVAISTIIQYGSFGKDAIVKIIIAAVLINFSLMMTKMVIDSSHILAWGFYDKIEERNTADGLAPGIPEELSVKGIKIKNLAGVFMAGFNPQKLLIPSSTTKDNVATAAKKSNDDGSGIAATIWKMFLIMILASALNFVVAFILFAGAIMFIIRVVVLWFVLLFSPFAFADLIFPSFKSISSKWWDALIKQAFFAPAFLFLFYLVTMMVNGGFLKAVITGSNDAPSAKILFFDTGGTIVVFFHFFVIGALLVGCLYLAQQMGAHGSGAMMKFGNKTGDWARNKFGDKAAWRGTKYGLRYGGGALADKILDEETGWGKKRWAKTLTSFPGVGMGLRTLGAMKKADEDKAKKSAEKYESALSNAGSKSLARDIGEVDAAGKESKSFAKRFLYAGIEGALKPGREGYRKGIAQDEKIEKEKIELKMSIQAQPFLGRMDTQSKLAIKTIDGDLDAIETELQKLNYELIEAVKNNPANVTNITNQINTKKTEKTTKIEEKEEHKENIENAKWNESRIESLKEREERRNEAKGLQSAIKSSGGGAKGGTP